ncbi:MAG: 30S ribosomal protein S16 [Candidatus Brocadiia bacterium]
MAVRIRLTRAGRKNTPFFRIAVFDGRTRRDGVYLERLGHYTPTAKDEDKKIVINKERLEHWMKHGAKPSEALTAIFRKTGIIAKKAAKPAAKKKTK